MTSNRMTARQFLAREIRLAREAKGMEKEDLADAVYVSLALVRAWEAGRRVPAPDVIPQLETTLGTNGYLTRMREDLVKSEPVPEFMGKWTDIECAATSLLWCQSLLIPGLLQTPEYTREVFINAGRQIEDLDQQVGRRMERQKVLEPENSLMAVVIIDEAVLHKMVGSAEIMHEQIGKLLTVAKQPNVSIQIVGSDAGAHPGFAGGFGIALMDGQEYVYVDDAFSGDVLEDPEDVAVVKRVWLTLTAYALPARRSLELLEEALERWATR